MNREFSFHDRILSLNEELASIAEIPKVRSILKEFAVRVTLSQNWDTIVKLRRELAIVQQTQVSAFAFHC